MLAQNSFAAAKISNLDLLTSEQTVIQVDAAAANVDVELVPDMIAVFAAFRPYPQPLEINDPSDSSNGGRFYAPKVTAID